MCSVVSSRCSTKARSPGGEPPTQIVPYPRASTSATTSGVSPEECRQIPTLPSSMLMPPTARPAAHSFRHRADLVPAPRGILGPASTATSVRECIMAYIVDFTTVSTVGLESSPVAAALAGLRANEARYFKNKYDHVFTVEPAGDAKTTIDWVDRILREERDIVISSRPLEATAFQVEDIRMAYVFYESGLSINVMYTIDDPKKRAVGFKLSEGMEAPPELGRFKFARQKSKLAGTIRGSYFAFKNDH